MRRNSGFTHSDLVHANQDRDLRSNLRPALRSGPLRNEGHARSGHATGLSDVAQRAGGVGRWRAKRAFTGAIAKPREIARLSGSARVSRAGERVLAIANFPKIGPSTKDRCGEPRQATRPPARSHCLVNFIREIRVIRSYLFPRWIPAILQDREIGSIASHGLHASPRYYSFAAAEW